MFLMEQVRVDCLTIHCSVTANGQRVNLDRIKADHEREFGIKGIGYHAIIQPDGELIQTRPLNEKGAHVGGHNSHNIGVCLAGTNRFTIEQFNRLWRYIDTLRLAFSLKPFQVFAHYEFDSARKQGKTCPNIRSVDIVYWYMSNDDAAIEKYLLPPHT